MRTIWTERRIPAGSIKMTRKDAPMMDVSWEIYLCQCGKEVVTVGGGVHNWNYERKPQEPKKNTGATDEL